MCGLLNLSHVFDLLSSGSKVQFVKQYARHWVLYDGEVMGVQMVGRWKLETNYNVNGDWALWPIS